MTCRRKAACVFREEKGTARLNCFSDPFPQRVRYHAEGGAKPRKRRAPKQGLLNELADDIAVDAGESEVATGVAEGQFRAIESEQGEDGEKGSVLRKGVSSYDWLVVAGGLLWRAWRGS
jgi:hypothetical protein